MLNEVFIGAKIGRWTVLETAAPTLNTKKRWLCQCECGTRSIVGHQNLQRNGSLSCGCRKRELLAAAHTTHGMNRTPTHHSWLNMISRCRHKSSPSYKEYGGRGITVCDQWQGPSGFVQFISDVGIRPSKEHSLDRIDPNGNYEPGNCRWATSKEQARNKRHSRNVTYDGVTLPLVEWAASRGIPRARLYMRLYVQKWPVAQALEFEAHLGARKTR